mgnify:CR=1 FL=1
MILKKPQQARRVASGVAVHDLNLIPSVPRTHNGFSSSVPGRMTPDRRRLRAAPAVSCCRPHPAR